MSEDSLKSYETDKSLCSLRIESLRCSGENAQVKYIVAFNQPPVQRAVTGIDIYRLMIARCSNDDAFGTSKTEMNIGVIGYSGHVESTEEVSDEIRQVVEDCVCMFNVTDAKGNDLYITPTSLRDVGTEGPIYICSRIPKFAIKHLPMTRAVSIVPFVDTVRAISNIGDENFPLAAGKIIKKNLSIPNITESAELCTLMLTIAKKDRTPTRFPDASLQELVCFSRKVIKSINNAKNYEKTINTNVMNGLYEAFGAETMTVIEEYLEQENFHISMFYENDHSDAWYVDTMRTIAVSIFSNDHKRCKMCHGRGLRQLPGDRFKYDGSLSSSKISNLTQIRLVATLLTGVESPFTYLLARVPKADQDYIKHVIGDNPDVDENGYIIDISRIKMTVVLESTTWFAISTDIKSSKYEELSIEDMIDHVYQEHQSDLLLPPLIPTFADILKHLAPTTKMTRSHIDAMVNFVTKCKSIDLHIIRSSVLLPWSWTCLREPPARYVNYLVRKNYNESLDLAEARLMCAIDAFYLEGTYDAMETFATNTKILSRNEAFDNICLPEPVLPYKFQVDYLNKLLAMMMKDIDNHRDEHVDEDEDVFVGTAEDPGVKVSLDGLLLELGFDADNFDKATPEILAYTERLCVDMTNVTGIDCKRVLFSYACRKTRSYRSATMVNAFNSTISHIVASIALILTRRKYRSIDTTMSDNYTAVFTQLMSMSPEMNGSPLAAFDRDVREESISPTQFETDSQLSSSFTSELSPTRSGTRDIVMCDICVIRMLCTRLSSSQQISIAQNTSTIDLGFLRPIAGSGKTTVVKMAASLIRIVKETFPARLPRHNFEILDVCDQPLVRSEMYEAMLALGSGVARASIANIDEAGKIKIESNFKVKETTEIGGRRVTIEVEPGFKCNSRDIFIMGSNVLVAYILGRRDGGSTSIDSEGSWFGNPKAFVFFDEFCAKIGNRGASRALGLSNGRQELVIKAFKEYAQSMLILSNAPSSITLVGASIVSEDRITDTIKEHQARGIVTTVEKSADFYVGSQLILPWGQEVNLWNICPQDLLVNLFLGLQDPLTRRTVGHRAAVQLRKSIMANMSKYPFLEEMSEYLNYDLGIYSGNNVANYAVGLLYFINMYATKYIQACPDLCISCGDALRYFNDLEITLPVDAPWPRTLFVKLTETNKVFAKPATSMFYEDLMISGIWKIRERPETRRYRNVNALLSSGHELPKPVNAWVSDVVAESRYSMQMPMVMLSLASNAKPKIWTVFGKVVEELRTSITKVGIKDRDVSLVMDTNPIELGINIVANLLKTDHKMLISDAENIMKTARKIYQEEEVAKQKHAAAVFAKSGRPEVIIESNKDGTQVRKKFQANRVGDVEEVEEITGLINKHTGRRYYDGNVPEAMTDIEAYLLSFDIICICDDFSEFRLKNTYEFIKRNPGRIALILTGKVSAYGINPENATKVFVMPRVITEISVETLKQFFCRAGRKGLSDDALLNIDFVTLVRLLEDSIHLTDSSLFPAIYVAMRKLREKRLRINATDTSAVEAIEKEIETIIKADPVLSTLDYSVARHGYEAYGVEKLSKLDSEIVFLRNEIARQELVAYLTSELLDLGLGNRDCKLLPVIVGAIQYHMNDPFGFNGDLYDVMEELSAAFSQARDTSSYDLYNRFMSVKNANHATMASTYITEIATGVLRQIKTATVNFNDVSDV